VRTPSKLVAVDRRRGRNLERTRLALKLAVAEATLIGALGATAVLVGDPGWLAPVVLAVPLVAVELWFDVRSRGRRLVPELCGATAVAAVAAAIVLADGDSARVAAAAWLIVAARALASIPFVRVQITRLRHREGAARASDVAQVVGVAFAAIAVLVDVKAAAGAAAVVALGGLHTLWVRRPPTTAKVLGLRQMLLGIVIAVVAAIGLGIG
jgi:hypothetical protein